MHGQRLVNRRDVGDFRELGRLGGDPVSPARVGMDEINAIFRDKGGDAPGVHKSHGESLAVNGHGLIGLPVVKPVRDPEDVVLSMPGIRQRNAVGFRSCRLQA